MSMTKVGVITNPGSQKNKKGLGELERLLDGTPDASHVVLQSITDIPEILKDFARREVGLVTVAGGDGTVQAVLTELYGQRPYETAPTLAVVPRGMTNMIAADVGLRRRGSLAKMLKKATDGDLEEVSVVRRILRLENALNHQPLYGMFFGGAGINRAIEACRAKVHPYKLEADIAAGFTLAGLLWSWLFHSGDGGKGGGTIFYGDRIAVTLDDQQTEITESLVILATTLDRLLFGSRPFWNGGAGHMRFTSIAYPPERMLRYAWRLLFGGEQRSLPETSYTSRTVNRIALEMDCPFTLDGELFEPTPGLPVILTAEDQARFVRL